MKNYFTHKNVINEIAKEQSFSKAAQNLYISQPALSTIVKKLEEEIGAPLFDRAYKPTRLTNIGEKYIECSKAIDLIEEGFDQFVNESNQLLTGNLNIGGSQLISTLIFPKYITRFSNEYPGVSLNLFDANSSDLFAMLNSGEVDLIVDNKEPDFELYETIPIANEHLVLGIPHKFGVSESIKAFKIDEDTIRNNAIENQCECCDLSSLFSPLKDIPFVSIKKGNDTRARQDSMFRRADFHPQIKLEVDRLTTLHNFLLEGIGAGIVCDTLLRHVPELSTSKEPIDYYRIPSISSKRIIYISYKQNRYFSKLMQTFCDSFRKYI